MAREMGINPRSLIKNIPSPRERWKAPVPVWIREMYSKRQKKSAQRRPELVPPCPVEPEEEESPLDYDDFLAQENEPPTGDETAEENVCMQDRQRQFREAAEYVAAAFGRIPSVQKVALFGSVAAPLRKEVPRFRKFRRARQELWHECKDVDLAVWVSDLGNLKALQAARGRAVNRLFEETDIGVADHQVDVFLLEPGTDRYLGRLCVFGECPKEQKPECRVPGCGAAPFLRQHEGFAFRPDSLRPERILVLFDRSRGEIAEEIPF